MLHQRVGPTWFSRSDGFAQPVSICCVSCLTSLRSLRRLNPAIRWPPNNYCHWSAMSCGSWRRGRCSTNRQVTRSKDVPSDVAYNLVIQFRRQAAEVAKLPPRRLSFKEVCYTFRSFLLNQPPCSLPEQQTRYDNALQIAAKDKLPNRPGRSYKRKTHPRRQKSTEFPKLENQKQEQKPQQTNPENPK